MSLRAILLLCAAATASAFVPSATMAPARAWAPIAPRPRAQQQQPGRLSGARAAPRMAALSDVLSSSPVVLVTKKGDKNSAEAAATLKAAKAKLKEVDVESVGGMGALKKASGKNGVPQIFVNGDYVGDHNQIRRIAEQDMLDPLLRDAGARNNEFRLPFQDLRLYLSKLSDNRE